MISVTRQWLKYSTRPNGAALYSERPQTLQMIETNFYRLYINDRLKNHCWLSIKFMALNFVVVLVFYCQFIVILAQACHICAFLLKKLSRYYGQWLGLFLLVNFG